MWQPHLIRKVTDLEEDASLDEAVLLESSSHYVEESLGEAASHNEAASNNEAASHIEAASHNEATSHNEAA